MAPPVPPPPPLKVNCSIVLQLGDTQAVTIASAFTYLAAHGVPPTAVTQLSALALTATWTETR